MYEIVTLLSINSDWLITANLLLSTLLLMWVLRYRTLYRVFRKEAEQHSNSIDELNEGFYRASIDGKLTNANTALVNMIGFETREELLEEIDSAADAWYIVPGRRKEFARLLRTNGYVSDFVSEAKNLKTGEHIWISENAHLVNVASNGKSTHYEGSMLDITDAVQRNKLEDRIEKLSSNLPGGLFQLQYDNKGNFTVPYVSQSFRDLLRLENQVISNPNLFLKQIHPEHLEKYLQSLNKSLTRMTGWMVEFKIKKMDGVERWIGLIATPEKLADGSIIFHGHVNDITERKEVESKIAYYAYYDPLTRLPNRTFFMHHLERAIPSATRSGAYGAILFLDIDNFKLLNDSHGHAKGDLLLKEVANRLTATVRVNDTVSRFGGDEFVILLDDVGKNEIDAGKNASIVAEKIISEFGRGFDIGSDQHNCSPSIGVVTFGGQKDDADALILNADIAMYEAKKLGKNNFVLFDTDKSEIVTNLNQLQSRLRTAIKQEELCVYFQPQIDHCGRIYGAEALVRWQHPDLGLLMPNDFIPLAEQSGLICDLNNFVLNKSLEKLAEWREQGCDEDFRLAVNISPQQLRQASFIGKLTKFTSQNEVPPTLLTLEVTEHSMARDFETTAMRMQEIRQLGIKISLDDFGTGYSSLSQLNELHFDEVKIDGSFIAHLEESKSSQSLVEAIIAMAKALDLDIVAEHVNTNFQERFLLARGCLRFQGYCYSKPLPEDEFRKLIISREKIQISA
ncbi:MAG: EAL domain-containing protein [Rhizobiaceae bacterium]|nr:EAL domain-containing protein [Rhizobiaceae bacterium]